MRVAFFGDSGYVGAREWIAHLAAQPDLELHAVVFRGDPRDVPGVRFHELPGWLPAGKARYFACVPPLRALLGRVRPDLLIAYRVVSYGFAAALTGFRPLVLAAQGQFIVSPETPRLLRHCARRAVRGADLVHAWAPPMAESLVGLGADPSRILVMPRGVDEERFTPAPAEPPPPLTLVSTRQLEPYYNVPTLLRAVRKVKDRLGPVRCLLAGEGGARRDLERAAGELGVGGEVSFEGRVPRDRLPALLRSAHLYVSAVPSDGTSSSLLEAMAAGLLPVVADNASNRHWIRDGEGGRLVPAFDADAYAEAILGVWASPELRLRARAINRALIEARASWRRNMAAFVAAYRDLAAGRRPAP
jgi:glycosyltransferase involved in cell wall biosynthesis